MSPKKVTEKRRKEKRKKRVVLSIETKQEIIEKHEKGMRLVDLAKEYGRNVSTISTFLKQKEAIKAVTPSKGLAIISKRRSAVNDEMERLLLEWIKERKMAGEKVNEAIICEKATVFFNDLVKEDSGEGKSAKEHREFKASHGWYEKFKRRTGIRSVGRHGEASCADHGAADEIVQKLKQWPDAVAPQDMDGFELEGEVEPEVEETISLGNGMGLEVNDMDINELIQEHDEDLTTIEMKDLEAMQYTAVQEESKEEEEAGMIPSARIKDILGKFQEVLEFVEKNHPEKVFTSRAIALFDDVCLGHFRRIVESQQKQKRQAKTTSEREHEPKRAKNSEDSS
ncbi:tigger transposable element-derived protein 2-like [Antennarius striatus]|uniref:tigger transposable element-derived protein 2-like n=1 Tax=Antennarius striatus TaxID=241820 RepID=UPI0035AE69E3